MIRVRAALITKKTEELSFYTLPPFQKITRIVIIVIIITTATTTTIVIIIIQIITITIIIINQYETQGLSFDKPKITLINTL